MENREILVIVLFLAVCYLWYTKKDECVDMGVNSIEGFDEEDKGQNIYNNLSTVSSNSAYGRKF